MAVRDAMLEVQEARLAYAAKRYTQAEEHYRNALAVMPDVPAARRQRVFIKQSLADALIARAIDYRAVGRYEEAMDFLKEAAELDPSNKRARMELAHTADPVRHNPALTPQHVGDVQEVQRLLELGHGYIQLGKYDEARTTFQSVLKIDPYNSAARQGMEKVEKHRARYFGDARNATRTSMLNAVDKEWDEPVPSDEDMPQDTLADGDALVTPDYAQNFAARLSEMHMSSIAFDDANLLDVIEALQNQILRYEASGGQAGRHINLSANFGDPQSPAYKQLMDRRVRLDLSEVSVKDVLDIISENFNIRYYYTPIGVELSLGDRNSGPLIDRTFKVPPHFFDGGGDSDEDDDDEADAFASNKISVARINPMQTLKNMGVTFPKGAQVIYSPSTRTLRVRNTAPNIQDIAELLDQPMDKKDSQIVLNVIAMEVSENDLNQLGFEWLLNASINHKGASIVNGGDAQQAISTATNAPVFVPRLGKGIAPAISSGLRGAGVLRTSDNVDSLIEGGAPASYSNRDGEKSPSIFGVRGVWNVADVTFIMNGLSQRKGVDILQNPQVVFSPGSDEQISVGSVDEMFFPETWEAGDVALNGGGYDPEDIGQIHQNGRVVGANSPLASGAFPTDFVRYGTTDDTVDGLGTILMVHQAEPLETAQGTFINIALTVSIKEFQGFINWGSPIFSSAITDDADIFRLELTPNLILQPMIKRYVENTQLTVAPGSVIVMGGLKEAKSVQFEDKIPVLGDLPLVGRFFRSSGESKMRKALLFFVRVDYVDPTGKDPVTGKRPASQEL